ncbi:MAG TPA: hypothetical protein V6C96_01880 [Vampirovibrionales bacterium]
MNIIGKLINHNVQRMQQLHKQQVVKKNHHRKINLNSSQVDEIYAKAPGKIPVYVTPEEAQMLFTSPINRGE